MLACFVVFFVVGGDCEIGVAVVLLVVVGFLVFLLAKRVSRFWLLGVFVTADKG